MSLILPGEDLQVIIRQALNEDVSTRERDLDIIKTWLKQQSHLPDTWNETGLMNFLRGCNFSVERAKKKIEMYFTMRAAVPEFFVGRDIAKLDLQKIFKLCNIVFLPGLTPDGKRVSIAGALSETEHIDFAAVCRCITMGGDIRLVTETYGVSGDIYILDARVSVLKNFLQNSPILYKKFFICVQEAYPVKIKEVHIINSDPFVTRIYNTVKPFLKEKLRSRIHIHENLETLYDYVPRDILPEEYGGTAGKLCDFKEEIKRKLEEFREWFKEQEEVVADESRRIGKQMNYDDLFGVDGSFKKLTID